MFSFYSAGGKMRFAATGKGKAQYRRTCNGRGVRPVLMARTSPDTGRLPHNRVTDGLRRLFWTAYRLVFLLQRGWMHELARIH